MKKQVFAKLGALLFLASCATPLGSHAGKKTPSVFEMNRLPAADGFVAEQAALRATEKLAADPRPLPAGYGQRVRALWEKHGCKSSIDRGAACRLNECEYGLPNCRAERIVLFRGESGLFKNPAVSGILRHHLAANSSAPAARTSAELIAQLAGDLATVRPGDGHTDGESWALRRANGRAEWRSFSEDPVDFGEAPMKPYANAQDAGLMSILGNIHLAGGALLYYDSVDDAQPTSLDPFVSFSSSAEQALAFATPDGGTAPGRLIVASVPAAQFRTACGDQLPPAGSLVDLYACPRIEEEYKGELELDAFVYTPADWILETYAVPPGSD